MSSLPKKNRVLAALHKNAKRVTPKATEGTNIPVGSDKIPELLAKAKETHQHNVIKHLIMLVQEDESLDVACLYCGGSSRIRKPFETDVDNDLFMLFKQLHVGCEIPKEPLGLFNVDAEKKNPLYVNKGTGVTVELQQIKENPVTGQELYRFVDLEHPSDLMELPKQEFLKFFARKEA